MADLPVCARRGSVRAAGGSETRERQRERGGRALEVVDALAVEGAGAGLELGLVAEEVDDAAGLGCGEGGRGERGGDETGEEEEGGRERETDEGPLRGCRAC